MDRDSIFTQLLDQHDAMLDTKEDVLDPIEKFLNGPQWKIYQDAKRLLNEQQANAPILGLHYTTLQSLVADPDCYTKMVDIKQETEELDLVVSATLRDKNLCAYSAFYIRPAEIHTIDHFLPKSKRLDLAFEWNNFRFCCSLVNSKKKDATDILDPFQIQPLWFALNFWDFSIYPSDELPIPLKIQVQHTIDTLGLNRNPFKNRRKFDYDEYKTCPDSLRKYSPFVWQEAERQGYPETAPTGFWFY